MKTVMKTVMKTAMKNVIKKPMQFASSLLPRSTALLIPLLSASMLSGCIIHIDAGSRPTEQFTENLSLPASDLHLLKIDADAGDLQIVGVVGLKTIEVAANIQTYARDGEAKEYQLTLQRHGRRAQLRASHDSRFDFGQSATIDLVVRVPAELALKIDDGSGDIEMRQIKAPVSIEDGSGSIKISDVEGDVTIDDDSGSIFITNVIGNVDLVDGSGDIAVSHITGNVSIEDDSGGIEVSYVSQKVKIEDGSGDIAVSEVNELEIGESGSGDVNVSGIGRNK